VSKNNTGSLPLRGILPVKTLKRKLTRDTGQTEPSSVTFYDISQETDRAFSPMLGANMEPQITMIHLHHQTLQNKVKKKTV